MTKKELLNILDAYEECEEININEIMREYSEYCESIVEELEERQHQSGFYSFQDLIYLRYRER